MNARQNKGSVISLATKKSSKGFSRAYKLSILKRGSRCKNQTELNTLLRRENVSLALLTKWWQEYSNQLSFEKEFLNKTKKIKPDTAQSNKPTDQAATNHQSIEPEKHSTLREILSVVWRGKWLLLASIIISMLIASTVVYNLTPRYSSKAVIMLENPASSSGQVSSSSTLRSGVLQNEIEILRSFDLAEQVILSLNLQRYADFNPAIKSRKILSNWLDAYKKGSLFKKDSTASEDDTNPYKKTLFIERLLDKQKVFQIGQSDVLEIQFTTSEPELSANIVNKTIELYFEKMSTVNAKVLSSATPAIKASYPKIKTIFIVALLIAISLGLLAIFIKELFDRGFRSAEQIERQTGLHSLGLIPKIGALQSSLMKPEAYIQKFPASPLSESIRSIYSNILLANNNVDAAKVLQITSASSDEGKSTIARCLAMLKRRAGMKAIIIDADLRNPDRDKTFNVRSKPGLAEYLIGTAEIYQIISQDKKTGVYIIPAGQVEHSPSDLLPTKNMDNLIADLSEIFDLIIIDTPPVLVGPDARIISSKVDVVVFLVKWAATRREVVNYALKLLKNSGANQIALGLSMVDTRKHAKYSYADSGFYSGEFKRYYIG